MARGFFVITRQLQQLERCSNPLRMRKVFLVLLKKNFFDLGEGFAWERLAKWGCFRFDFIVRSTRSLANTHKPVRKYTREYKLKLKPWITQGVISSIKHRDRLFRIYKRSKLLTDFESYKKFRNNLTPIKELATRKYYAEQSAQNSRNPKRTWTLI